MDRLVHLNQLLEKSLDSSIRMFYQLVKECYTSKRNIYSLREYIDSHSISLPNDCLQFFLNYDPHLLFQLISDFTPLLNLDIPLYIYPRILSQSSIHKVHYSNTMGVEQTTLNSKLQYSSIDNVIESPIDITYHCIPLFFSHMQKNVIPIQNSSVYKNLYHSIGNVTPELLNQVIENLSDASEISRFREVMGIDTLIQILKKQTDIIDNIMKCFKICFTDYHSLLLFVDAEGPSLLKKHVHIKSLFFADECGLNDIIIDYAIKNKDKWSLHCCRAIALNGRFRDTIRTLAESLLDTKNAKEGLLILQCLYCNGHYSNKQHSKFKKYPHSTTSSFDVVVKFLSTLTGDISTIISIFHTYMALTLADLPISPSENKNTNILLEIYPIQKLLSSPLTSLASQFLHFLLKLINTQHSSIAFSLISKYCFSHFDYLIPKSIIKDILPLIMNRDTDALIILRSIKKNNTLDELSTKQIKEAIYEGIKKGLTVELLNCLDPIEDTLPEIKKEVCTEEIIVALTRRCKERNERDFGDDIVHYCLNKIKTEKLNVSALRLLTQIVDIGENIEIETKDFLTKASNEEEMIEVMRLASSLVKQRTIIDYEYKSVEKFLSSDVKERFQDIHNPITLILPIGNTRDEIFFPIATKIEAFGVEFLETLGCVPLRFFKASKFMFLNRNIHFLRFNSIVTVFDCENLSEMDIKKAVNNFKAHVDANWEFVYTIQFLLVNYPTRLDDVKKYLSTQNNSIHVINRSPNLRNIINSVMLSLVDSRSYYIASAPDKYIASPKKTKLFIPLNAAEVHLFLRHYEISMKFYSDAMKIAKSSNDTICILTCGIGICCCLLQEKKNCEDMINDIVESLLRRNDKRSCKRIKLFQTQMYIDEGNYEQAKKVVEEIYQNYDGKTIGNDIFDMYIALQQASILHQLNMVHHQRYILQRMTSSHQNISFSQFACKELAKLLDVFDLEKLDNFQEPSSPHLRCITKVQFESIQAHVLFTNVSLRNKYDTRCSQLILRLLTRFSAYLSKEDQVHLIKHLKLVSKVCGSLPIMPSPTKPLPFLKSVTIEPAPPVVSLKSQSGVFIVNPTAEKAASLEVFLVTNESSVCHIVFDNPLLVPLQVDNIEPISEGVKLKSIPISITIPPLGTIETLIRITPLQQGELRITGLSFICCSIHFKTSTNASIRVIEPLPLLKPTSIPPSISLFPGERHEYIIKLLNAGSAVVGKASLKVRGGCVNIPEPFGVQLPIFPSTTGEMRIVVSGESQSNSVVELSYNSCSDDTFMRIVEIPVNVLLSKGLVVESWNVVERKNECIISCILHNQSHYSFTVTMEPCNQIPHTTHISSNTIFSESQSRRKMLITVDKPFKSLTNENIHKFIKRSVNVTWNESSGRIGVLIPHQTDVIKFKK
ncbi:Trafficking protein particle complex subunit 11 C-terminal domain-containing protein [Entamoeba marina]